MKNAAGVWRGTGPAIFPPLGKATWSLVQFVKTALELKGVGGEGQERRKREETPRASIATSSIYLCFSKSTWVVPLQKCRKDKSKHEVTKHKGTKCVTDSPGGYSQEDFFFFF